MEKNIEIIFEKSSNITSAKIQGASLKDLVETCHSVLKEYSKNLSDEEKEHFRHYLHQMIHHI